MTNLDFFSRKLSCVLGLPFDVLTTEDAVAHLRKCCLTNTRCFLTTPNLNFAITARSDDDFYQSVVASDLSVADGMPIVLLSRLAGAPLPERVAGSTLFEKLSQTPAAERKIRVYFFGGQAGVAEKAHERLNVTSQGMESCGWFDPGFVSVDAMSTPEIIQAINTAQPDFLVVALGAKKGQQWIMRNRDALQVPVISHLGAVINFVAGEVSRAPGLVQKLGMEWLWRIKEEPALWRRYWHDGVALVTLLATCVIPLVAMRILKPHTHSTDGSISIEEDRGTWLIRASGDLTPALLKDLKHQLMSMGLPQGDLIVNLEHAAEIETDWLAFLLLLQKKLSEQGRVLRVSGASASVAQNFKRQCIFERLVVPSSK